MPIVKYPDIPAGWVNHIDLQSLRSGNYIAENSVNLSAEAFTLDVVCLHEKWRMTEMDLSFSAAVARDFGLRKVSGRGIITHRNDWIWVGTRSVVPQQIILSPGWYATGALLAAEVKAQLDANEYFAAAGLVFTVTYDAVARTFTIGTTEPCTFWYYNTYVAVRCQSVAAPVLGFNANQGPAMTVTSNVPVDMGTSYVLIAEAADVSTSYVVTDSFNFDIDSALRVYGTAGPDVVMTARVTYEIQLP